MENIIIKCKSTFYYFTYKKIYVVCYTTRCGTENFIFNSHKNMLYVPTQHLNEIHDMHLLKSIWSNDKVDPYIIIEVSKFKKKI
jgi:hypothetical protein